MTTVVGRVTWVTRAGRRPGYGTGDIGGIPAAHAA
jgi:hypothetical protein